GVTELTMKSYLTTVYTFTTWAPIVLWRIATYQVRLAVTGIIFMFFVRRATSQSRAASQKNGTGATSGADPGLTAAQMEKEVAKVEKQVVLIETRYSVVKTFRFAAAGIAGFGVTELALSYGLLVFYGRLSLPHASYASPALIGLDVLSLVIGVSASFFINERITVHVPKTLKGQEGTRFKRFLKFQAVSGIGNAGIILVQLVFLAVFEVSPVVGTVVGALVTYPLVYFISIKYVWKAHRTR
ncbi:MAG: hypothetical protein OK474_12210, partial [Thaumarchaeota archaeon]|nr:hypothetical protein [Nitrososphaerota archaeon]